MDAPDRAMSYGSPTSGTTTPAPAPPATGPFTGGGLVVESRPDARGSMALAPPRLSSPFSEALTGAGEADDEALASEALLGELDDDAFAEAVEALVDEVAARHLSSAPSWSSEAGFGDMAATEAEAWAANVGSQADRFLERLGRELGDRPLETLSVDEVAAASARIATDDSLAAATEQLFGGLVKKVVGAAKGIVKTGIRAVKGIASLADIVKHLRRLVPWLIRMVVNKAIHRLPRPLQWQARRLARRFGAATEADIADEFDHRLATAILAPDEATADQVVAEAEAEAAQDVVEPLAELDAARARLVTQLVESEPDEPPVAAIEQFVPAVMAVMPALRAVTAVVGRDRIKRPAANLIARLIRGHVGRRAARALAPAIADVGLKLIGLEAEAEADPATLGAEALAATVEDTIREVAGLPDEALSEPVRMQAEVERAFTEAAARHLPRHVLRPDVAAYETDDEGGAWVAMPRAARPRYRYRKCSRVYRVPIGQARARAIVLSGEDTLEERLLDAGVDAWPVEAEVHLYEALPGTRLGHLAAYEVEEPAAPGAMGSGLATDEFEDLTPEVASLLVGQPGLGRRIGPRGRGRPLRPGHRLFRLVVPGVRVRRRRPRLVLRLDATSARPALRVHLRLTERQADRVAQALAKNAHPAVVVLLRGMLGAAARRGLAERLDRQATRRLGTPLPAGRAGKLAGHIVESLLTAVAKQLPSAAATLAAATRDPAPGVTLTFTYTFASPAAVRTGTPSGPTLTIRPGQRRD